MSKVNVFVDKIIIEHRENRSDNIREEAEVSGDFVDVFPAYLTGNLSLSRIMKHSHRSFIRHSNLINGFSNQNCVALVSPFLIMKER